MFRCQAAKIAQFKPFRKRFELLERFEPSSPQGSEKMGEIENVGVGHRIHHVRHRGVVAAPLIALVLAQRLHEVILALALSASERRRRRHAENHRWRRHDRRRRAADNTLEMTANTGASPSSRKERIDRKKKKPNYPVEHGSSLRPEWPSSRTNVRDLKSFNTSAEPRTEQSSEILRLRSG